MPSFFSSIYYSVKYQCGIHPKSRVQISRNIIFGKGTVVKPYAIIQVSGPGRIILGDNCAVSSFNHLSTDEADVVIGNHVRIGPNVTIVGSSRNYNRKDRLVVEQGFSHKGIRIGDDVFIGAGAVLLDGCTVGDGAVIGVGSVVSGTIPPYAITFGMPAKPIFFRT
jgi:acetyltransferase-like isoleucine patch superfamily enzyme